jgi:hypothetical protein
MSVFRVELPEELRAEVAKRVARTGVTESAWVENAVREKLAADAQLEYLEARAARGDRQAFEQVLRKVPADPPCRVMSGERAARNRAYDPGFRPARDHPRRGGGQGRDRCTGARTSERVSGQADSSLSMVADRG